MPRKNTATTNSNNAGYKRFDDLKLTNGATLKNIFFFVESESFNFTWDGGEGVILYKMKVLKNNKGEWFISFPSQKSEKDGKYYNFYYVNFEDNEKHEIIGELLKYID